MDITTTHSNGKSANYTGMESTHRAFRILKAYGHADLTYMNIMRGREDENRRVFNRGGKIVIELKGAESEVKSGSGILSVSTEHGDVLLASRVREGQMEKLYRFKNDTWTAILVGDDHPLEEILKRIARV
jgi:hypothetical protein